MNGEILMPYSAAIVKCLEILADPSAANKQKIEEYLDDFINKQNQAVGTVVQTKPSSPELDMIRSRNPSYNATDTNNW